jgi:hypothetical protein
VGSAITLDAVCPWCGRPRQSLLPSALCVHVKPQTLFWSVVQCIPRGSCISASCANARRVRQPEEEPYCRDPLGPPSVYRCVQGCGYIYVYMPRIHMLKVRCYGLWMSLSAVRLAVESNNNRVADATLLGSAASVRVISTALQQTKHTQSSTPCTQPSHLLPFLFLHSLSLSTPTFVPLVRCTRIHSF